MADQVEVSQNKTANGAEVINYWTSNGERNNNKTVFLMTFRKTMLVRHRLASVLIMDEVFDPP